MKIVKQEYKVVPVAKLTPHPRNPNQGDVGSIATSIDQNGFYGATIVQKSTGYILAGEHRWKAAKASGGAEIPIIEIDVDDAVAVRILLADNQTAKLSSYDENGLADLLRDLVAEEGPEGLLGTGFDGDDLDDLLAKLEKEGQASESKGLGNPVIGYQLVFDDEAQQQVWFAFLKHLKATYPDAETIGERLAAYIEAQELAA